jgi:hypothetical protein
MPESGKETGSEQRDKKSTLEDEINNYYRFLIHSK